MHSFKHYIFRFNRNCPPDMTCFIKESAELICERSFFAAHIAKFGPLREPIRMLFFIVEIELLHISGKVLQSVTGFFFCSTFFYLNNDIVGRLLIYIGKNCVSIRGWAYI